MTQTTKRVLFILFLLLLLPVVVFGQGFSISSGLSVTLNQKMSTRSGPGTGYSDLGTYFDSGDEVHALTSAWDSNSQEWWIQIEFSYKGKLRRAYTAEKRLNIDASSVPKESVLSNGQVKQNTKAYYGPGTKYSSHTYNVPAGTSVSIFCSENGFVQVEYTTDSGKLNRVWISSSDL